MIFAGAEHGGAGDPGHLVSAGEQGDSAADRQRALQLNGAANVAGVVFAAGLLDVGPDRVQFPREFLDVLGGEVCVLLDVGDSHVVLLDFECAVAGCRGDAGVDSVALAVLVSGPEVADVP